MKLAKRMKYSVNCGARMKKYFISYAIRQLTEKVL
jgi:hypothetical protein